MLTVAYLANLFPSAVEPYVVEEVEELRRRRVRVIAGSIRKPGNDNADRTNCTPDIVLWPARANVMLRAIGLCIRRWRRISLLMRRVIFRGSEGPVTRLKALAHTALGACYAVLLQEFEVDHIHVHHGYFGSWVAMVAARLLGVDFSMTLHGSDLLLHGTYLEVKLQNCRLCRTVSEYNRNFILRNYPGVKPGKVVVARLGVNVSDGAPQPSAELKSNGDLFTILAVGRLHAVKDHAFLVRACAELRNVRFECLIAGDGPEWRNLQFLIQAYGLEGRVSLLGHVSRECMHSWYDQADLVVLTSRSEGIPLVLMEAMARGGIVLAPAITGIPELVIAGKTGFLYEPGSLEDFVARLLFIRSLMHAPDASCLGPYSRSATTQLQRMRLAAATQVRLNFNRSKNLESFGDLLLEQIAPQNEGLPDENFVHQQI
jgi:colanic acid/amylovoran biosynthesis glycosyltransferase